MATPLPEPSVGPEFGIDPLRPDIHLKSSPPVTSTSPVSTDNYRTGTEFGGVSGIIAPPPHVPTAAEWLSMVYAIDPTDPGTESGSIQAPELEGDFR